MLIGFIKCFKPVEGVTQGRLSDYRNGDSAQWVWWWSKE